MGDQKTLEELRAKIMASMGKDGGAQRPQQGKEQSRSDEQSNGDQDSGYKRQRSTRGLDGRAPKRPRAHAQAPGAQGPGYRDPASRSQYDSRSQDRLARSQNYNRDRSQDYNRDRSQDYNRDRSPDNGPSSQEYRPRSQYSSGQRRQYRGESRYNADQRRGESRYGADQPSRYSSEGGRYTNQNRDNRGNRGNRSRDAFQQTHLYKNMIFSRLNNTLLVRDVELSSESEQAFRELVDKFCKGLGINARLARFVFTAASATVVLEFSSAECATVVLAARSFLAGRAGLKDARWTRPNGYVLQEDCLTTACNAHAVALENVVLQEPLQEAADTYVRKLGVASPTLTTLPITFKDGEAPAEFTGCLLLSSATPLGDIASASADAKWFRPNETPLLVQETRRLTYNGFPQAASGQAIPPSRVLLLANLVSPLELAADASLAGDIEECLTKTLPGVEALAMRRPGPDYKLSFQHLGEQAGCVYATFRDAASAASAVAALAARRFNGRQALCAYVDEHDYTDIIQQW
ncbi:Mud2 protein [Maudiozyma humilis]|uniref:Mud2 protein n=1 Tax=Maudiozyma humilis TaxID=51915 RepID=A0AAV5RQM2_MAUHU|nr:Mud2 protein [Kazachstania humilis]